MSHAWHFDESEITVTIMLQRSAKGGEFEVIPRIRGELDGGCRSTTRAVQRLLEDEDDKRKTSLPFRKCKWEFEEGTLALFRGSESLHRVTRVESDSSRDVDRLVAVLCYADKPGGSSSS